MLKRPTENTLPSAIVIAAGLIACAYLVVNSGYVTAGITALVTAFAAEWLRPGKEADNPGERAEE